MSFSRLTPRSVRTGIARGRGNGKIVEKSSRHLRLWEAIRRTREEIDNWQRQVVQVDALFQRFIVPREEQLTNEYCNVTALLIRHFEHTELSAGDRSLLGLWISENLQSLSDHPFAPIRRRQALNEAWRIIIRVDGVIENQLARLARSSFISAPSHDEQNSQLRNTNDTGNATDAADQPGNKQPSDEQPTKSDYNASDQAQKISILEQRLSIERLFRQLAKVLHPDREQDESLKAEKHVLMSQCLIARDEKDIDTLLSLYCEHVGNLPDDLNDTSHEQLITALQQQLKQLQMELRQLRFGDPLHTQIVERYSALSDADCLHRINAHASSLDVEIEKNKQLVLQLDTPPGLEDALAQRREMELDKLVIDELTGM